MIMTYDWLMEANKNLEWKKTIENAMLCDKPQVLLHQKMYRLAFDPSSKTVTVRPFSADSMFSRKIVPKKLTYELVYKVINGNWDAFSEDNVFDVPKI